MKTSLLLFSILIFVGCSTPQNKAGDKKSSDSLTAFQDSLDTYLKQSIDPEGAGVSVLVAYNGEPLFAKSYGMRDIDSKLPLTPNSNMRLASVSKQFTALAVLALVDEGKLRLHDTLYQYFPAEIFTKVTVLDLLRHTSGIANYEDAFEEDTVTHYIVQNHDVLEWYMQNPEPLFAPGSTWEYSNGGYNLLATLVEKASGQPFDKYAKEKVFIPAGMTRTNYFNLAKPIDIPERAMCYEQDSTGAWHQVDGNFLNGCLGEGAVYTSINEYLNYDRALRSGTILSPEMHALIFESHTELLNEPVAGLECLSGKTYNYGMGWFTHPEVAHHAGGWWGTATIVLHEHHRPLTIAIFRNSSNYFGEVLDATYAMTDSLLKRADFKARYEARTL